MQQALPRQDEVRSEVPSIHNSQTAIVLNLELYRDRDREKTQLQQKSPETPALTKKEKHLQLLLKEGRRILQRFGIKIHYEQIMPSMDRTPYTMVRKTRIEGDGTINDTTYSMNLPDWYDKASLVQFLISNGTNDQQKNFHTRCKIARQLTGLFLKEYDYELKIALHERACVLFLVEV